MQDILPTVLAWLDAGRSVAVATLVAVERSGPRAPGAAMAVNDAGEVAGSVSGGCVEGALFDAAQPVLTIGAPQRLTFGIADDQAFEVGLTCGGTVHLFIDRAQASVYRKLAQQIADQQAAALVTVLDGPRAGARLLVAADAVHGGSGAADLDAELTDRARQRLPLAQTGVVSVAGVEAFIHVFAPPPRMFIFGAVDFAAAMVTMGNFLGYHTILCDAREVFATRARFPDAAAVVVDWPDRLLAASRLTPRDAVVVLTHDEKFDIPALKVALASAAGYIGAMGSRRTNARRLAALQAEGIDAAALDRIASPIGLDIGGKSPRETAVAIAAEIIALGHGKSGGRLKESTGRIHGPAVQDKA